MPNPKTIRSLINDIESVESTLTEWEFEFTDSISTRLDNGWGLTAKQLDTLNGIHERRYLNCGAKANAR